MLGAALARHPGDATLHLLQGDLFRARGEGADAAAAYLRALALDPEAVAPRANLGAAYQDEGRFEDALRCYDETLRRDPANLPARFNRALLHLLMGNFSEGLRDYELRWELPELTGGVPRPACPAWEGEPLRGRAILLQAEQGFGDTLQFARYIPAVIRAGGRVRVHCPPKLLALLQRSFPEAACASRLEDLPPFDVRAPLLSLPRILGLRPDAVPTEHPYLRSDADVLERRRRELALRGARFKVGLCWATASPTGQHRSIPAEALAVLGRVPGVEFISLQRNVPTAGRPPLPLVELQGLESFDDDAALVPALDLVITMDTALAHLAGALGARAWTVLSYPPDWRWGLASGAEGERTPWYPTMRLFRPLRKGAWVETLDRVGAALEALAAGTT